MHLSQTNSKLLSQEAQLAECNPARLGVFPSKDCSIQDRCSLRCTEIGMQEQIVVVVVVHEGHGIAADHHHH